jgi:hypothetical protein
MAGFDTESGGVSSGCVEIRMECIGQAQGTGGLWWVAEGFADGTSKPRGLFNGKDQAEELARKLAEGAGIPLQLKSYDGC